MTKKADADAAYRRDEAQRALVVVLDAAEHWHSEAPRSANPESILAAIATVRAEFLKVSAPPKAKTLAGQIDLVDGSVEGELPERVVLPNVPPECPGCGLLMHLVYGGSWTTVFLNIDHNDINGFERPAVGAQPQLQCSKCSKVIDVSFEAWLAVRTERRRTVGKKDTIVSPVKQVARARRDRSAG